MRVSKFGFFENFLFIVCDQKFALDLIKLYGFYLEIFGTSTMAGIST
jgi:hypothetical protein